MKVRFEMTDIKQEIKNQIQKHAESLKPKTNKSYHTYDAKFRAECSEKDIAELRIFWVAINKSNNIQKTLESMMGRRTETNNLAHMFMRQYFPSYYDKFEDDGYAIY